VRLNLEVGEAEFAAGWCVRRVNGKASGGVFGLSRARQPAASSAPRFLDSRRLKLEEHGLELAMNKILCFALSGQIVFWRLFLS
jgi:hypothetical protein